MGRRGAERVGEGHTGGRICSMRTHHGGGLHT